MIGLIYELSYIIDGVGINDQDDSKYYLNRLKKRNPNTCFFAENDKKEIIGTIIDCNN